MEFIRIYRDPISSPELLIQQFVSKYNISLCSFLRRPFQHLKNKLRRPVGMFGLRISHSDHSADQASSPRRVFLFVCWIQLGGRFKEIGKKIPMECK